MRKEAVGGEEACRCGREVVRFSESWEGRMAQKPSCSCTPMLTLQTVAPLNVSVLFLDLVQVTLLGK